jgi:hypothetical protein
MSLRQTQGRLFAAKRRRLRMTSVGMARDRGDSRAPEARPPRLKPCDFGGRVVARLEVVPFPVVAQPEIGRH